MARGLSCFLEHRIDDGLCPLLCRCRCQTAPPALRHPSYRPAEALGAGGRPGIGIASGKGRIQVRDYRPLAHVALWQRR